MKDDPLAGCQKLHFLNCFLCLFRRLKREFAASHDRDIQPLKNLAGALSSCHFPPGHFFLFFDAYNTMRRLFFGISRTSGLNSQ